MAAQGCNSEIMTEENQANPGGAADDQQFSCASKGVSKMSFESPKSPEVFTRQWQPSVSVDINTRATPLPKTVTGWCSQ